MATRKQVVNNFLWRFFERCGAQGVTFVVAIVLARLLDPAVYGTVALVMVFTNIMQVFIDSGMGNALIQKKNADDLDFSSMFYFNLVICISLYLLLFFSAPLIASFYQKPELIPVVRVLGLTLIISGLKNVQQAYVSRKMMFKRFFFATLGGTIGAAAIGIYLAWRGYGVWALVAQYLFNATIDTVILWLTVKWRPKRMFSFQRLKVLFRYGWKLLVSGLIDKVYDNLRALIIGKMYTSEDLAFYQKGNAYPATFTETVNSSLNSVLFPVMSQAQDEPEKVRDIMRKTIKTSTFIIMPMMFGLAACAEPLIRLLMTEKWLPCVPFMRIFCAYYAFYPIHTTNLNAIKAMGRSDLFLILEIVKKVFGLLTVVATMWFGVMAMAIGLLVLSVIEQIINSWPNRKLVGYSYLRQLMDILPAFLISLAMAGAVYCVSLLGLNDLLTVVIQVAVGILLYVALSYILRIDTFDYLLNTVKSYFKKSKKKENE